MGYMDMTKKIDVSVLAVQAKDDPTLMLPLWEAVERLIGMWAYKYTRRGQEQGSRLFDIDDLKQAGYIALVDAVAGYEPRPDAGFATYLCFHVRHHFAEVAGIRGTKRRPEIGCFSLDAPLREDTETTRVEMLADPAADFADDVIDREASCQDCAALLVEVDRLPDEQRQALMLTSWDGLTYIDAAGVMGTDAEQVRQQKRNAVSAVRYSKIGRLIARERYAVHRVGLRRFKTSFVSEVEKHVEWLDALEKQRMLYAKEVTA